MAPYPRDQVNELGWDERKEDRVDFCLLVVNRANEIANGLVNNKEWRHAFHNDEDSQVRYNLEKEALLTGLQTAARELIDSLKSFQSSNNKPLLVVVFDE